MDADKWLERWKEINNAKVSDKEWKSQVRKRERKRLREKYSKRNNLVLSFLRSCCSYSMMLSAYHLHVCCFYHILARVLGGLLFLSEFLKHGILIVQWVFALASSLSPSEFHLVYSPTFKLYCHYPSNKEKWWLSFFSHSPHSGFQILGCVVQEYADIVEDKYIGIGTTYR